MIKLRYKGDDFMDNTKFTFDSSVLEKVLNKYHSQIQRFIKKEGTLEEMKKFVSSLIFDLYVVNTRFEEIKSTSELSVVNAEYRNNEISVVFNEQVFNKLVQDGDFARLMILIFHEGTHKYQSAKQNRVKPINKRIYDEDLIKFIMKTINPTKYGSIDTSSPLGVQIHLASYYSYLNFPNESGARESSYDNARLLFDLMSKRPEFKDYVSEHESELVKLAKEQDGYLLAEQYGSKLIGMLDSWVDDIDIESFAKKILTRKILCNKCPDYDVVVVGGNGKVDENRRIAILRNFLSRFFPAANDQWNKLNGYKSDIDNLNKLMSFMFDNVF